jgi:hypothetical protein
LSFKSPQHQLEKKANQFNLEEVVRSRSGVNVKALHLDKKAAQRLGVLNYTTRIRMGW